MFLGVARRLPRHRAGLSLAESIGDETTTRNFSYTENQAKFVLAIIGLLVIGLILTALLYGLDVFAD